MAKQKRDRRKAALLSPPDKGFLREWRESKGYLSQGDLAKATAKYDGGLTRQTICRLETGSIPYRKKHLLILAKTLGCTPSALLGENPKEHNPLRDLIRSMSEAQLRELFRRAKELVEGR